MLHGHGDWCFVRWVPWVFPGYIRRPKDCPVTAVLDSSVQGLRFDGHGAVSCVRKRFSGSAGLNELEHVGADANDQQGCVSIGVSFINCFMA